jgi:hypothetical protein
MDERPDLVELLLAALRNTRPGVRHYLERTTGRVVSRARARENERDRPDANLLQVPQVGEDHGFETMRLFIASVRNPGLRERLQVAALGRGAFRRFREVLAQQPRELQRWLAFRDSRLRDLLSGWLADHGLQPAVPTQPAPPQPSIDPQERLEELTLLVAYLSSWEENRGAGSRVRRAWKGFRVEVLERLQAQGLLTQGRSSKSLLLTDEGVARALDVEARLGLAGDAPPPSHGPSRVERPGRRLASRANYRRR